jgi:dipeptidyl aminopeptidase/acylaminoacyl peptidase
VDEIVIPDETHFLLRHASWMKISKATADYFDRHMRP